MDNLLLFIRSDKRYHTLLKTYIPALYFNVSAILLLKPHEKKKNKKSQYCPEFLFFAQLIHLFAY